MAKLISVILAGGRGERLWPLSDTHNPKQFTSLTGGKTIIEETLIRTARCSDQKDIYISTMSDIYPLLKKTLPNFPKKNIILEPMIRDTACALLLATLSIPGSPEDVLMFIPADHYVDGLKLYQKDILKAFSITQKSQRATLIGIPANFPSTEYGYLKVRPISLKNNHYQVDSFIEKPNLSKAKKYFQSKNYFWNSGIFMFNRQFLLNQFKNYTPELYQKIEDYRKFNRSLKTRKKAMQIFSSIEKISFDFAIAERLSQLDCIKASFYWDDIGNWEAFFRIQKPNREGNILNTQKSFTSEAKNNLCIVEDNQQVLLNGVQDLIIISKNNRIYVAHRKAAGKIKKILKEIN